VDGLSQRSVDSSAPDTGAQSEHIQEWFGKILPLSFFDSLKRDLEIVQSRCIFTLRVTTWMMIMQRLSPHGTLAATLSELLQGNGRQLLESCKRVREDNISANTGGYNKARQKMPQEAARRIATQSFEQLSSIRSQGGLRERLFLLDGSSIRLAHTPAIIKAFPPAENQHGESHWPVIRVAVMHHVATALAMAPQFGPMYGNEAVSEQRLAESLIDGLPPESVLIGDRNFGVFSVAWHARRRRHQVLVRMTEVRARRLLGCELNAGDHQVMWEPTREDRRSHPAIPADAGMEGRLIVARPGGMKEDLYLFTTLEEPAEEVIALYGERWNVETDLRSIKEQVRLHTIEAQSPKMVACELLLAIASYNLIRVVMAEAARHVGVNPRDLSFSRSHAAFWAFARAVAHTPSAVDFARHWQLLIRIVGQSRLYKRHRPTAPREVWPISSNFPTRKVRK
jgi:putative transposase